MLSDCVALPCASKEKSKTVTGCGWDVVGEYRQLDVYATAFTLDTYSRVIEQVRRQRAQKLEKYLHQISNG